MSVGEAAAIVVLAGLCGVVVGTTIAVLVSERRQSSGRRTRLSEAYTLWLAARLTASRASLSFVAAFRALGAERADSVYLPLRTDEAQRARAYWCDAMQKLDLAEAALVALGANDSNRAPAGQFLRVGPDALRRTINGDETDVDRLAQYLHTADRNAIDFVRSVVGAGKAAPRDTALRSLFVQTARRLRAIVDRWGDLD